MACKLTHNLIFLIGIFALNVDASTTVLACPAKEVGNVSVHFYGINKAIIARSQAIYLKSHEEIDLFPSPSVSSRMLGAQ